MTDGTISAVAFIAGGAMLVGGAALFLTAPQNRAPAVGLVVSPSAGPEGVGLLVRGEF
jgi:hypothetical protein